jgi:hypothetical protein
MYTSWLKILTDIAIVCSSKLTVDSPVYFCLNYCKKMVNSTNKLEAYRLVNLVKLVKDSGIGPDKELLDKSLFTVGTKLKVLIFLQIFEIGELSQFR